MVVGKMAAKYAKKTMLVGESNYTEPGSETVFETPRHHSSALEYFSVFQQIFIQLCVSPMVQIASACCLRENLRLFTACPQHCWRSTLSNMAPYG